MLYAVVPLLVLVVGLLLWAWGPPPAQKVGEWMFVIGLLWTIYPFAGHMSKLL